MIIGDGRVTERYIASAVGISQEIVHSILTEYESENMNMRKHAAPGYLDF